MKVWRRPPGCIQIKWMKTVTDNLLKSHNLTLTKAESATLQGVSQSWKVMEFSKTVRALESHAK